jgi:hypothetical protein
VAKTPATVEPNALTEITTPDELVKLIMEGPSEEILDDPIEVQRQMILRIAAASSPEELTMMGQATPWRENMLDVPVEVHDVRVRKSDFDQGSRVFAIADAIDLRDGSHVVLTTGGANVVAQLLTAKARGWLPQKWKLIEGKETAKGFHPLWLVAPSQSSEEIPF